MVKIDRSKIMAKAWATRRANAKKGKKRGRKPGVKVGPYNKKGKLTPQEELNKLMSQANPWKVSENNGRIEATYTPSPILTLCGQLEDAILLLENRISNAIAKINSLM